MFASVGATDPCLNSIGKINFQLQHQLACYSKQDPPPNQVKPIPILILQNIMAIAIVANHSFNIAVADMIALAFFFLLHPGEYTGMGGESSPFCQADVQGPIHLNLYTTLDTALLSAMFASLMFTSQKNCVHGEVIGLAHSGNPQFSPTICLAHYVIHLQQYNATPPMLLASVWNSHTCSFNSIKSPVITVALHTTCTLMGPVFGFSANDVATHSLQASGAMALLCAQVDSDIICLIGHWHSDKMLCYLTVQAAPVLHDFSS
jgi:hypothetical protein